jgi:hypothetical protein
MVEEKSKQETSMKKAASKFENVEDIYVRNVGRFSPGSSALYLRR